MDQKLEVTIESFDSDYRSGYKLIVKHNGSVVAEEIDNGEPEDNLFVRDYAWIKPLLEKVYDLAFSDGMTHGINTAGKLLEALKKEPK